MADQRARSRRRPRRARARSQSAIASTLGSASPPRAAVAGQVDGEHVAAVMREITRLQRPHAVIVRRAVHEHAPSAAPRRTRACRCTRRPRVPGDVRDCIAGLRRAAYSARLRSSIRSSAILEADRQPDRAFGDAGAPQLLGRHPEMRRRRRMDDQRLRVADVGEMREDPQRLDEAPSLLARAAQVEAEHGAAAARQQPLRERVIGMVRQAPDSRSPRPADARAGTRRSRACSRRGAPCAAAASRCPAGSGTPSSAPCTRRNRGRPRAARAAGTRPSSIPRRTPCRESRRTASVSVGNLLARRVGVPVEASAESTSSAADDDAVARQELRRRMEHEIGAVLERPHQPRRRERRVDEQRQAVLVRERRDARNVEHVEPGIAERLAEQQPRVRAGSRARQASMSRGSTNVVVDAEARQRVVEQVVRAAVQRARRDDVRARADSSVTIARCSAAWPLAVAIAPTPPSSAAIRSSSTAQVGLEMRE